MTRLEYEFQFEELLDNATNELDPKQYKKFLENIFDTVDLRLGEMECDADD